MRLNRYLSYERRPYADYLRAKPIIVSMKNIIFFKKNPAIFKGNPSLRLSMVL